MIVITIENPLAFGAGLCGNIVSFLVVLAPVPTFYKVLKRKSTESFQSVPYVIALFSALMWVYYGLLTKDVLLLSINSITCAVESIYLIIYLIYASNKARVFTIKLFFLFNVGLFGSLVFFSMLFVKGKKRVDIVGWIGSAFAVAVFVAPLSIMKLVIKTKSVEYMPFLLSFFLTLNAIAWFSYGILLKDFFVALPNVMGFMFGMAQMILYFIYMNHKKDEPKPKVTNQDLEAMPAATLNSDVELANKKSIPEKPTEMSEHPVADP
ncbi:bidirectional sugar transporter SWEET12-like [Elaeis guineensis]|uniref:bidirectional sugar transporter SWEET12-like n=1 Tax=Elaeis guineensis var. tenera TaxID=51953 RepID=UPI003C6D4BA7